MAVRSLWQMSLFCGLWLFIIGVSVHDGYLVLANRPAMLVNEMNPVGRWLIEQNGGDIWLLLTVKTIGTMVAATWLLMLFRTRVRVAWMACVAVAGMNALLLLWLYQD